MIKKVRQEPLGASYVYGYPQTPKRPVTPALRLDVFLEKNRNIDMNSIKKEPARVRPQQVKFWVTEEEKQRIEKRAAKFQSTAAYLREMALKGKIVERPPSITLEHYMELNKIGNNINQLTRRVNSTEASIFYKSTKKELEQMLAQLIEVVDKNRAEVREILDRK